MENRAGCLTSVCFPSDGELGQPVRQEAAAAALQQAAAGQPAEAGRPAAADAGAGGAAPQAVRQEGGRCAGQAGRLRAGGDEHHGEGNTQPR